LPTNFIAESTRNALNLLEEQPPDVIEAMVEGAEEAERAGGLPKQRTALRAEKRRLCRGITALDQPDHP
jgi:hypothetical protein